ncbi:recombinase family protein [Agromyces sp. ISL-38]|uniref:recombinase family protein n=1 Tax=Agromyces sp. ISL-38 TaxID=2819107 RepID=UPI001BEA1169|nr:recombinase family protein [Agromyces sp. ISL-38]MBT2497592.1 recombinase family protein [Agromyces sp. ISL-38]
MLIGFARVSTVEQDEATQIAKLLTLGVDQERIYIDHGFTGKTMTRAGLDQALAACREGDVFAVPAIDRLARNALGTLELLKELHERDIVFSLNGIVYDPNDPMAKLFFTMLAAVAEAEGGWISIRTREAMARPSVRAKLRGRQPRLTPKQDAAVTAHYEAGDMSVPEIAALFNVSRPSVYRAIERHRLTLVSSSR